MYSGREVVMDIFEFAMQMELDGAKLYRDLARNSKAPGVERILLQLAEDEDKHYAILERMAGSSDAEMPDSSILDDAVNIFAAITEKDLDLSGEQSEIYLRAAEIEKKSRDFYFEKAAAVDDAAQRELLLRLAGEEKRHLHLLEGMVEFLKCPDLWLENAEFTKLTDY